MKFEIIEKHIFNSYSMLIVKDESKDDFDSTRILVFKGSYPDVDDFDSSFLEDSNLVGSFRPDATGKEMAIVCIDAMEMIYKVKKDIRSAF